MLPLMEPVLAVDLSLFPPYGSSSLGRDSRLSGSFGNASLDGVTDFYSQLIYKVLLQFYCCWSLLCFVLKKDISVPPAEQPQ